MTHLTRHKIREKTVCAVYTALIEQSINDMDYNPKKLLCDAFNMSYEDIDLDYREVFIKALSQQEEIEKAIEAFLVDWTFSRLSYVVQAILLVSYAETVLVKVVPKQVSINEAVVLTKKYDSDEDSKYVNAVLERSLSKALGIPSDYQGKVAISEEKINSKEIEEVQSGQATLLKKEDGND